MLENIAIYLFKINIGHLGVLWELLPEDSKNGYRIMAKNIIEIMEKYNV